MQGGQGILVATGAGYTVNVYNVPITTDWIQILPADPRRWYVAFSMDQGTPPIYVSPVCGTPSTRYGFSLPDRGVLPFTFRDCVSLVQSAWFVAGSLSGNILITEVVLTG